MTQSIPPEILRDAEALLGELTGRVPEVPSASELVAWLSEPERERLVQAYETDGAGARGMLAEFVEGNLRARFEYEQAQAARALDELRRWQAETRSGDPLAAGLARNVRALRTILSMNRRQFAELVPAVSRTTMTKLEEGKPPQVSTLSDVATGYGVSAHLLLTERSVLAALEEVVAGALEIESVVRALVQMSQTLKVTEDSVSTSTIPDFLRYSYETDARIENEVNLVAEALSSMLKGRGAKLGAAIGWVNGRGRKLKGATFEDALRSAVIGAYWGRALARASVPEAIDADGFSALRETA